MIGVSFIGWASDYSAIVLAVRKDGHSLSAISHRLIAPRTRMIMFTFIFFYLLLIAGAFMGIMSALMAARPDVVFRIVMLAIMGLLMGQMLYRWKMDLVLITLIVVPVTLAAMAFGPFGATANPETGAIWSVDLDGRDPQQVVSGVDGGRFDVAGAPNAGGRGR